MNESNSDDHIENTNIGSIVGGVGVDEEHIGSGTKITRDIEWSYEDLFPKSSDSALERYMYDWLNKIFRMDAISTRISP